MTCIRYISASCLLIWLNITVAASADRKLNVVENSEITSSPSNQPELERARRILKCQMEEANGDLSGEGEECLRSEGIEPTTAAEWNNQGWARFNHHRYEEAISDFTHALELAPDYEKARINRANSLARINKFQEALDDIQFILNKDPNSLSGIDNQCNILDRAGEGNSALESCSRAVKLYPNSSAVRNDRGWTFWGLGKIKEAATDFVTALEIDPAQPQASSNLFRVLPLLNDPKYSRLLLARLRTRAGDNESLIERIAATLIKEQLVDRL